MNGSLRSLAIGFNGSGGAQGKGGSVTIENDGSIVTQGKNAVAIAAQSVGGGGGVVKSMTSDMTFDPSKLIDNPQGRAFDIQGLSMTFGGGTNSQGDGGAVQVTNNGSVQTALRGAHGILAQSIGGGGGLTVGGQLIGGCVNGDKTSVCGNGQANTNNGNAGPVTVTLNKGATVATLGDGAYGILAQSVGGGGGIAGDLSNVGASTTTLGGNVVVAGTGNGGNVGVALTGATVTTSGSNAPAILAQSVGGGGGLLSSNNTLQIGSAGGTGTGGALVSVTLANSTVSTTGALGSPAIVVQNNNVSTAGGASIVTLDAQSTVSGGRYGTGTSLKGAIVYLSPGGNVLNNAGTIRGIRKHDPVPRHRGQRRHRAPHREQHRHDHGFHHLGHGRQRRQQRGGRRARSPQPDRARGGRSGQQRGHAARGRHSARSARPRSPVTWCRRKRARWWWTRPRAQPITCR